MHRSFHFISFHFLLSVLSIRTKTKIVYNKHNKQQQQQPCESQEKNSCCEQETFVV